jgi:hypothetical protein
LEKQKNHWKKTKKQRHIKWYTNGFWNGILKVYDMVH